MSDTTDTRLFLIHGPYTNADDRTAELVYFSESALPEGDGNYAEAETENGGKVTCIPGSIAHDFAYTKDSVRFFNGSEWLATNEEA